MSKSDPDIYLVFSTPDGMSGIGVGLWNYGSECSDPVTLPANEMLRFASHLCRNGKYTLFENKHPDFKSYIVVKKSLDKDKALAAGKDFMLGVATGLLGFVEEFKQ